MKKIILFLTTIVLILIAMSIMSFAKPYEAPQLVKHDYVCTKEVIKYYNDVSFTTIIKYNSNGNLTYDGSSSYSYDSNGNLIKYSYPQYDSAPLHTTDYSYDSNGNLIKEVTTYPIFTGGIGTITSSYTYDSKGYLTKIVSKGGYQGSTIISYTYDNNANLIKEIVKSGDEQIESTNNTYNSNGYLSKSVYKSPFGDFASFTALYTYNSKGVLTKEVRNYEDGSVYTYTFDSKGRLTKTVHKYTDFDDSFVNETKIFTYNEAGNLIKEEFVNNGDSYSYVYHYNNKGNLTKITSGSSTLSTFTYDNNGNLIKEVTEDTDTTYTYAKAKIAYYSFKINETTYYIIYDDNQDYTGKPIKPIVSIFSEESGYTVKRRGVDYRISYSNNTKVGTGKIKIHFEGYDDIEIPFTICKHKYDAGKITKAATCKATGTRTYTCSVCKGTKTEAIAKLAHKFDSGKVTKASTCKATGVRTYTCTVCKGTKTETIAKKAHKFDEGKITKASTCTVKGVKTFTCTVCKGTKTEAVALKAHKYTSAVTKATTAKDGKVVKTCSVCKKSTSAVIPKVSSIALAATSYTYNGSVRTPGVTVKDSKGKVLKNGTDYTVTYSSGRKEVGSYTAKVTLKGNYSGSKTFTFKITLGKVTGLTQTKAKGIGLSWNAVPGASGYEVVLTTNNGSTTKTTTKTTLSSASAKGSAKVKVRAYRTINGKKVYGAYSSVITAKSK